MIRLIQGMLRSREGSVSIIGALILPVLIGIVALVAEFGHGLLARAENQRVADLAAYAGALAYNATSDTAKMTSAVNKVAGLNGIDVADVTTSLVTSPKTATNQAVTVQIRTGNILLLAPILGASSSLPVKANSYAELNSSTPACIIALSSSDTGITLSGGTQITATACAVASNNTVTAPCGTKITTIAINYNSSTTPANCNNSLVAPTGKSLQIKKTATTDPLSGNAGVSAAIARLSTVTAMTAPAAPSVSISATTVDISFPWYNDTSYFGGKLPSGCSAVYGSNWTIKCAAGGTYNFGSVTIQNGSGFALTGTSSYPTVFNFKGTLTVNNGTVTFPDANYNITKSIVVTGGSTATFGAGTYKIVEGIKTDGGTTATFGAGTYTLGTYPTSCSGATYSICHTGTTLTFNGSSTYSFTAGIYNNGGSTLKLGNGGTNNSYVIGGSSGGNAIYMGGGAKTFFGDATGTTFKLVGNLNVGSGGGSCLTLPVADQHDIKGYMLTAGGTILGSGVYTVNGFIGLGVSGGGNVTCNGTSVGLAGNGVTLVSSGSSTVTCDSQASTSFCVAAGYSNVSLTAPTSGTTAKLLVIGPSSAGTNTSGAAFAQGAAASMSGVFYYPNGQLRLGGGASVANGTGACLQLIGSKVTLTGGTSAASACITNSNSGASVVLVQ